MKKGLIVAVVWIILVSVLGLGVKFLLMPYWDNKLEDQTSSDSRYENEIRFGLDSFSGYCILRSKGLKRDLAKQATNFILCDDKGDTRKRMEDLESGKIQMAVFTIDSIFKASRDFKKIPCSIIAVIDESKGADALVANKSQISSVQDLDNPKSKIILTGNSPSEFLAQTILAHFNLPDLSENWMVSESSSKAVFERMKNEGSHSKNAYVLWEPYVSKARENPEIIVLLDSSKIKGCIVDVLVARREFLIDKPELVDKFLGAYFRTLYSYSHKTNGMESLVSSDAVESGSEKLSETQAKSLVHGIHWKNTLENYSYFGLHGGGSHVEDILLNIKSILTNTGDKIDVEPSNLFFTEPMKRLFDSGFHPGKGIDQLDLGIELASEELREDKPVEELSEAQWKNLLPLGNLKISPISFARGTARLNTKSEFDLEDLKKKLDGWPQCYLKVVGHSRKDGNEQANEILSQQRADAVVEFLIKIGVDKNRLRSIKDIQKEGVSGQSVSFLLGQLPY